MVAIVNLLKENEDKNVAEVVALPEFTALVEAKRGGGSPTEDNWLVINGTKVGRVCAVLGKFYLHVNEDKEVSHFYRNGSYHIVVEKLKNLKAKAHKLEQEKELARLEEEMLEGVITPKEWKQAKDEALKPFEFSISDDLKEYLASLTKGYDTKEDLAEAIEQDTAVKFKDIEDDVNRYLAKAEAELLGQPVQTEEQAEETVQTEPEQTEEA